MRWFVVMTAEGMDARVAYDLARQGVQVRLPYSFERNRYGNRWIVEADLGLTPYLFVGLAGADKEVRNTMALVRATACVESFLPVGGDPVEIQWAQIDSHVQRELAMLDAARRRVRRREPQYEKGEKVWVAALGHLLQNQIGTVTDAQSGWLGIDFPGALLPWTLREEDVKPVDRVDHARRLSERNSKRRVAA